MAVTITSMSEERLINGKSTAIVVGAGLADTQTVYVGRHSTWSACDNLQAQKLRSVVDDNNVVFKTSITGIAGPAYLYIETSTDHNEDGFKIEVYDLKKGCCPKLCNGCCGNGVME